MRVLKDSVRCVFFTLSSHPRVCQCVLLRDYRRLGVVDPNRYWVHTPYNLDYSLCDTYPRYACACERERELLTSVLERAMSARTGWDWHACMRSRLCDRSSRQASH